MGFIILITIICIPILEIIIFIEVGERIGLFNTIFIVLFTTIVGFSLMKSQGLSLLTDAQVSLKSNRFPSDVVFHGLCIFFASILLLTPGFLTDFFGFLVFLPPFRNFLKVFGFGFLKNHIKTPFPTSKTNDSPASKIIDGDFHDITDYKNTVSNKHNTKKLRD